MKAMIFAAGLGSRLKPLTDTMPKALVPVAGRPMLEHVILKLKASGFTEIVINIHHFGEQIIDFLKANNDFGLPFSINTFIKIAPSNNILQFCVTDYITLNKNSQGKIYRIISCCLSFRHSHNLPIHFFIVINKIKVGRNKVSLL